MNESLKQYNLRRQREVFGFNDEDIRRDEMADAGIRYAKVAAFVALILFMVDVGFMLMWAMSGQTPPDSFHLGAVAQAIFSFIF